MQPGRFIGCAMLAVLLLASATAPASEFITIGPDTAHKLPADAVVLTPEGRWTRDGFVPLPGPSAASDYGLVVVGNTSAGEPYRWTAETGIDLLGAPPDFPGASLTVTSVSGDGKVIGGHLHLNPGQDA